MAFDGEGYGSREGLSYSPQTSLPEGSVELDEEAKRELRDYLVEATKAQRPELTSAERLRIVEQVFSEYVSVANQTLREQGGFSDGQIIPHLGGTIEYKRDTLDENL